MGDGIGLRIVAWVLLTGTAVGFVLRYAARVRADPTTSLVGRDEPVSDLDANGRAGAETTVADQMAGHRDLPMGHHDMAAMTGRDARDAFTEYVAIKHELREMLGLD